MSEIKRIFISPFVLAGYTDPDALFGSLQLREMDRQRVDPRDAIWSRINDHDFLQKIIDTIDNADDLSIEPND